MESPVKLEEESVNVLLPLVSNFNPMCRVSPSVSLVEYPYLFKPDIKSLFFVADALRLQTHGRIAPRSCQTSCKGGLPRCCECTE